MCILSNIINIDFIARNIWAILVQKREKAIAKILIEKGLKLATAESCTGGLISSRMTDLSGSSAYIVQNFVTYANEAKTQILGVNSEIIDKFGVVSEKVASEMAKGLKAKYDCSVAISITGIAGPLGGSSEKPVGLAWVGISNGSVTKTYKIMVNSKLNRRLIKYAFSNQALKFLLEFLNENY